MSWITSYCLHFSNLNSNVAKCKLTIEETTFLQRSKPFYEIHFDKLYYHRSWHLFLGSLHMQQSLLYHYYHCCCCCRYDCPIFYFHFHYFQHQAMLQIVRKNKKRRSCSKYISEYYNLRHIPQQARIQNHQYLYRCWIQVSHQFFHQNLSWIQSFHLYQFHPQCDHRNCLYEIRCSNYHNPQVDPKIGTSEKLLIDQILMLKALTYF